ncbi:hypothetical protein HYY69_01225 [Candidatus Woesearchaeota archaeon]|nr:hypothetical protein [Candidatus Woesearchaeota archaeon]
MITHEDQMKLFNVIAQQINSDIVCYAFGGTAMMFYGYKNDTKDIDLLFEQEKERTEFMRVIQLLGFKETSPLKIYIEEKLRDKYRPLMFKRDDDMRFDLFVKKIFRTEISEKMKEDKFAAHQFKGKYTLTINALRTEHIVMLKSVTDRDKDFEDILTIIQKDKYFNWQYLIDEAIWQYQHGDTWIIYDLEETIKELQKYVFVEQKYLKQLYDAVQEKNKKNDNDIKNK